MNNLFIWKDCISFGYFPQAVDIVYLLAIIFGILTIIEKNPIFSVLYLIGLFLSISSLLIIIGFSFIGLAYILVYVGAISILFLFILMLINIRISELSDETEIINNNKTDLAVIILTLLFYIIKQILSNVYNSLFTSSNPIKMEDLEDKYEEILHATSKTWDSSLVDITHITGIGNVMYTDYAIWLVIVSIILLLAMVGAIVITIKQGPRG